MAVVFLVLAGARPVQAAVVINEFSPASNPEWVELYNTESGSISLKDSIINFGNNNQDYQFCEDDEISGNAYRLIILSSSWLNNDGDSVTLKKQDVVIDSVVYGSSQSIPKLSNSQSATRSPDGSSDWVVSDSPSQSGTLVDFNCPTPSPTPSPTPTASPTLTQTPPTPKATGGTAVTPKPTTSAQVLAATVAAEVEEMLTPMPTASAMPETEKAEGSKFAWLMIAGGGVLAVAALLPLGLKWYHDPSWLKSLLKGGDRSSFGQD